MEFQAPDGSWEPALGCGIVSQPLCPPEGRVRTNTRTGADLRTQQHSWPYCSDSLWGERPGQKQVAAMMGHAGRAQNTEEAGESLL